MLLTRKKLITFNLTKMNAKIYMIVWLETYVQSYMKNVYPLYPTGGRH